ncbi:MAG TPA: hypothetical protein VGI69_04845 [Gaiellaceae bacterium]|jgi:hypothetical protein
MNKKRVFAPALAAALLGVIGTASVASAAPTSSHSGGANANQIGIVRIDPNNAMAAYVTGNYTCPAGAQAHLFVSVKQVATGAPDNRLKEEGSSQYTSAWLETHPAPDTFTCDGTWHQGTWRITDDPLDPSYGLFDYGFGGPLIPGMVYVQFCWDDDSGNNAWHAYSEQFARAGY